MANWAIVTGINDYHHSGMAEESLEKAVPEALQMTEWLLAPEGGDVPMQNLSLLLAPYPTEYQPGMPDVELEPTRRNIVDEIDTVLRLSGEYGERFYLYFSGHGLTNRMNSTNEEVLIPTDVNYWDLPIALGLWSIIRRLRATQFFDQFFFIDGCRNMLVNEWHYETYEWGDESYTWQPPETREQGASAVQQFVFYATSPGVDLRVGDLGNERAAFTDVLLQGLRGRGSAKVWRSASAEYVVDVESLFNYVEAALKQRRSALHNELTRRYFQLPKLWAERADRPLPILARYPEEAFDT